MKTILILILCFWFINSNGQSKVKFEFSTTCYSTFSTGSTYTSIRTQLHNNPIVSHPGKISHLQVLPYATVVNTKINVGINFLTVHFDLGERVSAGIDIGNFFYLTCYGGHDLVTSSEFFGAGFIGRIPLNKLATVCLTLSSTIDWYVSGILAPSIYKRTTINSWYEITTTNINVNFISIGVTFIPTNEE